MVNLEEMFIRHTVMVTIYTKGPYKLKKKKRQSLNRKKKKTRAKDM